MPSSWLRLTLRGDPASFDAVSNFLIERGAPGVVIKNKELQAYYPHSPEDAALKREIGGFLRGIEDIYRNGVGLHLRWHLIRDRNWNSAWRRFFTPQKIARSFWVTPPWALSAPQGKRHVITIDPGMAFGTGTHATTRGCLEFIEKAAASFHGRNFLALDVGTGSGILAIGLAKLGAKKVVALDNDPLALKAAHKNLRANQVVSIVHLSATPLCRVRKVFPLVVANLTGETILEMSKWLEKRVVPEGYLILSGILKTKAPALVGHFVSRGFKLLRQKKEKEWATLLFRRKHDTFLSTAG